MSPTFITLNDGETKALAVKFGRRAKPGDVFCLFGQLGSGKTTFVQGFARGAGFKGAVTSPSFGIAREYRMKKMTLYHLDLFRLGGKDIVTFGLEQYLDDPKGICLIEWPEPALWLLPVKRLELRFSHRRGEGRTIAIKPARAAQ